MKEVRSITKAARSQTCPSREFKVEKTIRPISCGKFRSLVIAGDSPPGPIKLRGIFQKTALLRLREKEARRACVDPFPPAARRLELHLILTDT